MTEPEQRARFDAALEAFARDVYEHGFHELLAQPGNVDPLDEGERAICLHTDGTYSVVINRDGLQTPECLVLIAPDFGDTMYCLDNVLDQADRALVAPVVELEGVIIDGR